MEYRTNEPYGRPADTDRSWPVAALNKVRRARVGAVRIELRVNGRPKPVVGELEDIRLPHGDHGHIELVGQRPIPADTIVEFTLLSEPLDRSDEMGR